MCVLRSRGGLTIHVLWLLALPCCHGTTPDYNVEVGSNKLANAAWYYAEPKTAADSIKGRIAFWKGVKVKKKNFVLDKVQS